MNTYTYMADSEAPSVPLEWKDYAGNLIDFSSGYTFTVQLVDTDGVKRLTKTSGIVGSATSPNVVITWANGELAALAAGAYRMLVYARDGSGADRVFAPSTPPKVVIVAPAA